MKRGIVQVSNPDGHRQAYLDLLSNILDLDKMVQEVSRKNAFTLVFVNKLLFATVGPAFRRYFLVCLFRALLNKPSATLFLGANEYCDRKGINLDIFLIKIWKTLPKQHLFSIISFDVVPQLSRVTNDFIYDPQLWDVWRNQSWVHSMKTELSASVEKASAGRKILLYIGKAKISKSFNQYADFVIANSKDVYGVAAGKVLGECVEKANELKDKGMMIADRYVSDDELFSLYGVTDMVWCYYGPEYDQSSGVFGRAIQLGIPTIIRKSSIVERISQKFGVETHPVEIAADTNYHHLFDEFRKAKTTRPGKQKRVEMFRQLQNESVQKLKNALELKL